MLEFVHWNSAISYIEANVGFKFALGDDLIRISEDNLNEYLNFNRSNLIDEPISDELLTFFWRIYATLADDKIPLLQQESFTKRVEPMLHNLVLCIFSKDSGWHGITILLQKIYLEVTHNLNVKYGHILMERILKHINSVATHCPKW